MSELFSNIGITDEEFAKIEQSVLSYTIKTANSRKMAKRWENPAIRKIYVNKMRSLSIIFMVKDILEIQD